MATVSFKKENIAQSAAEGTVVTEALTVAEVQSQAPAIVQSAPRGSLHGQFDMSDVRASYLSLVGKTGKLSDTFHAGSFIFNKDILVGDGKKPMEIVVVDIFKKFVQDLPFGSSERPKEFTGDKAYLDAQAAGFILGKGPDCVVKKATLYILIPQPENISEDNAPYFPFEAAGKKWAYCRWDLKGSSYSGAGKDIIGHTGRVLNDQSELIYWQLTSELIPNPQNSWWAPKVRIGAKTPDDLLQLAIRNKAIVG